MKRLVFFLAVFIFAANASACGRRQADAWDGMRLYYMNTDETMITGVPYVHHSQNTKDLIAEMIDALKLPPKSGGLKTAKPDTAEILSYSYEPEKSLILNFDSGYYELTGTTEVLCRAAVVKSLCQIDGVDLVEFYVSGQPLVLSGGTLVGIMRAEDFMAAEGTLIEYETESFVTLYFADRGGEMLLPYLVNVSYDGIISNEQLIVRLLLRGPDEGRGECIPTMPDGTKINKISTKDTICYVDLSSGFLKKKSGVSAEAVLYSIVNSLTENTNITRVQFLIDGEKRAVYQGVVFNNFFERNLSLIDGL